MISLGILVVFSALLCTAIGGWKEDNERLHQDYKSLCEYKFPDANEMDAYLYQDYFCLFMCMGKDENDNFFSEMFSKRDGTECQPLGYGTNNAYQCLNRTCVRSEPVNECKRESGSIGTLTSMEENECSLTCKGDKGVKTIPRLRGSTCTLKEKFYVFGTCMKGGMCKEMRTYVHDPDGGNKIDATIASSICTHRHCRANQTSVSQTTSPDLCEFFCGYLDDTMESEYGAWEILTAKDGYSCSDSDPNLKCLGGRCLPPEQVQQCQSVTTEKLTGVDADGCKLKCKGTKTQKMTTMSENSKCSKTLPGEYSPTSGTCTKDGECNTTK